MFFRMKKLYLCYVDSQYSRADLCFQLNQKNVQSNNCSGSCSEKQIKIETLIEQYYTILTQNKHTEKWNFFITR